MFILEDNYFNYGNLNVKLTKKCKLVQRKSLEIATSIIKWKYYSLKRRWNKGNYNMLLSSSYFYKWDL